MPRRPSTILAVALFVSAAFVATDAAAQQQSRRDGVILHEYIEPSGVSPPSETASGSESRSAPTARAASAQAPPGLTLNPRAGDLILGPEGPVDEAARRPPYGPRSPRSGASTLDDQTSRVDDLDYHSAFDPSVFPYKRTVSQNRVREEDGTYQIINGSREMSRVRTEAGGATGREDAFWGSFLVDADAGKFHPIPSVAPEQRIVQVETEPNVPVAFYRDGADNYYVRLRDDGLVRINAKIAAPQSYFAGRLRGEPDWQAFEARETPGLSEEVRSVAGKVAGHVGISSEMSPKAVLERLIYHYRNFETKPLPDRYKDGDLYAAISTRQIGVCRHRSLAFVVTAQAFGIPARYITNEAHAFVEIFWPPTGWRRIDLGGAARQIGYRGGSDDQLHDTSGEDPFPKPPSYREEMRQMRERGASSEPGSSARESNDGEASQAESESSNEESLQDVPDAGRAGQRSASKRSDPDRSARHRQRHEAQGEALEQMNTSKSSGGEGGASSEQVHQTRLSFRSETREVFRGSDLTVYGVLSTVEGQSVAGRTVEIRFGRVGASPDAMTKIGSAETRDDGRFQTTVTVPETTGIGRWSIVAVFPGDQRFGRATAK